MREKRASKQKTTERALDHERKERKNTQQENRQAGEEKETHRSRGLRVRVGIRDALLAVLDLLLEDLHVRDDETILGLLLVGDNHVEADQKGSLQNQ